MSENGVKRVTLLCYFGWAMNYGKRIECDRMRCSSLQLRLGKTKGLVWQASAVSTFKGVLILLVVVLG